MKTSKRKKLKGFTLIEILVVIGILAILLSVLIVAVNPFQQLSYTTDVAVKAVAQDFINSSIQYFATKQTLPWNQDPTCQAEIGIGQPLSNMPACINDLIGTGKLASDYANSSDLKNVYFTTCGKSAVLCYSPKSKVEYKDEEPKYTKFGVNDPGCPGNGGTSTTCYWCKPILNDSQCLANPTPTPTPIPPTPTPTSHPSATPTPTPTPRPTATPTPPLYGVGGYKLDDPKFFQTYAVVVFPYPGFPAYSTQPDQQGGVDNGWMIDISFRPDFGGTTVVDGFGYSVNGVPVTTNADTDLWAAYAGGGLFGSVGSLTSNIQTSLTSKYVAFVSMPFEWSTYVNGCGKTIYWRVANFRTGIPGVDYDSNKYSPTYSNTVDCTTKVGAFNATGAAPLNWYIYYPYINGITDAVSSGEPYNSIMDTNGDGKIDWVDYIILSMDAKMRAGGWQPPE